MTDIIVRVSFLGISFLHLLQQFFKKESTAVFDDTPEFTILWTQELEAGLWTLDAGLWTLGSGC